MACKYKDIFGKPGTGAHKYRFGGVAVVDLALTLLIAYVITYFTEIPLLVTMVSLLLLGIFFHWVFCVKTATNVYLGI